MIRILNEPSRLNLTKRYSNIQLPKNILVHELLMEKLSMNVRFIHVNIYNIPYKKKERTEMEKFTLNYSLKNIP